MESSERRHDDEIGAGVSHISKDIGTPGPQGAQGPGQLGTQGRQGQEGEQGSKGYQGWQGGPGPQSCSGAQEERLASLLWFVLYGNWQDVGLDKNPSANAFTDEQRGGILYVVYAVAAATIILSNMFTALDINLNFPALDWQLETPLP